MEEPMMSDFTMGYVKPRTDEEYQTAIDAMLAELERSEQRTVKHQERIERLKAETAAIGARSAAIQARTQACLDSLPDWMRPNVR